MFVTCDIVLIRMERAIFTCWANSICLALSWHVLYQCVLIKMCGVAILKRGLFQAFQLGIENNLEVHLVYMQPVNEDELRPKT